MQATRHSLTSSACSVKPSAYLVNPVFDLLFVCGGLILALVATALYFGGGNFTAAKEQPVTFAIGLVGAILIGEPHSAATLFRLYGEGQNLRRFKFIAFVLPIILTMLGIAALTCPPLMAYIASIYLVLTIHHTLAQSYGITKMYCGRASYILPRHDHFLLKAIMWTAVTASALQLFSPGWQRAAFHGVPVFWMPLFTEPMVNTARLLLLGLVALLLGKQAIAIVKGQQCMPLPAMATTLFSLLIFAQVRPVSELIWLFIPAFFHGSQYLSVTMALFLNQRQTSNREDRPVQLKQKIDAIAFRYVSLLLSAITLFWIVPWIISRAGPSFVTCSALVLLLVSLHHFVADAYLWRLRDKSNSTLLQPA